VVPRATETRGRLRIFISYAAFSAQHKHWVLKLADELTRYDFQCDVDQLVIMPGDNLDAFMQQITHSDVFLPICSEEYTRKAEAILGGVGKEISIALQDRKQFIPIIRDNPPRKLPSFLNALWYADMDRQDWRGEPFANLVSSIQRLRGS
jgi:hypothetical protein